MRLAARPGHRARWHAQLCEYNIEVLYVKRGDNTIADVLSRWMYLPAMEDPDAGIHGSLGANNLYNRC